MAAAPGRTMQEDHRISLALDLIGDACFPHSDAAQRLAPLSLTKCPDSRTTKGPQLVKRL